jgi:hypothetical protein
MVEGLEKFEPEGCRRQQKIGAGLLIGCDKFKILVHNDEGLSPEVHALRDR